MKDKRFKEFRKELRALLKKYDASIALNSDPGSDWHGITGEQFQVSFKRGDWHSLTDSGLILSEYEMKLFED
jgi:hypothetical protein